MMAITTKSSISVKPGQRKMGKGRGECGGDAAGGRRTRPTPQRVDPSKPPSSSTSVDGSGTNESCKAPMAIVSQLPVPEEAERAATRSQTLGWLDIAAKEGPSSGNGVAPHTPGSLHEAIVVNEIGERPSPYCSDHAVERP